MERKNFEYTVRIDSDYFGRGEVHLWIVRYNLNNRKAEVAKFEGLNWEYREQSHILPEPSMKFDDGILAPLAKALQEQKYLNPDFFQNDAEAKALRYHLEDMRKIVFSELDVRT